MAAQEIPGTGSHLFQLVRRNWGLFLGAWGQINVMMHYALHAPAKLAFPSQRLRLNSESTSTVAPLPG